MSNHKWLVAGRIQMEGRQDVQGFQSSERLCRGCQNQGARVPGEHKHKELKARNTRELCPCLTGSIH